MAMSEREGSRSVTTGIVLTSIAVATLTVAVVAAWLGQRGHESAPSARPPGQAPAAVSQSAPGDGRMSASVRDAVAGPYLAASDPLRVTIPSLAVTSSLVELGLTGTGALEVPSDPARAGWYTSAPTPGTLGPAVIAGHVTWNGEPAVFYDLGALQRGDTVEVLRADGRTAVFSVQGVARFPKDEFPTRAVYGAVNHAGLRLITCGGLYDESAHRYLDNVVVFARLSDVRRAPS